MSDWAHDWTDVEIERLKLKITREFSIAKSEMAEKMKKYLEGYEKRRLEWVAKVAAGVEKKEEYDAWLKRRALDVAWYKDMIDMLTDSAVNADREAMLLIDDKIPSVFAENANYSAYSVEMGLGHNTHSFDLYDEDTVRRLMSEDRRLLPPIPKARLNELKDKIWNQQKFTSAVTQSILQGESIPHAARRMMGVFDMDRNSAFRAARTAITGAENSGRVHSYQRAKSLGIDLEQEWLATLDTRTRHTHRLLDGTHVPVGEKFNTENGELEFPGDPTGPASEVYNCRCTLVPWFPWMKDEEIPERWSRLPEGMTYDEWKEAKATDRKASYKNEANTVGASFYGAEKDSNKATNVVDGKSMLGTWKRRDGEFDFEVEDVINAQGFDGLPRVVNATDFDEAAAESNFVAIRGYRAPSQEVLDDYRRQLYEGKWYVDCSSGGAYHGQGMYTFSTAGTKPTDRMLDGVKSFSGVNGVEFGTVETMTVDPSFRSVEEDDIAKRFQQESLRSIRQRYGDDVWKMTRWSMGVDAPDETYAEVSQRVYTQRPADVAAAMQEYVQASQLNGMDKGSAAALLGYDGIHVNVSPEVEYTVMLNRTKLIIRES